METETDEGVAQPTSEEGFLDTETEATLSLEDLLILGVLKDEYREY